MSIHAEAVAPGDAAAGLSQRAPAQITTRRLRLRQWRTDDFAAFAAFYADDGSRFVGGPCGREEAWRKFAIEVGHWTLRGYGFYAVEERASGVYVGFVGLWNPEGWPGLELGWILSPAARGKGYATEAAWACHALAFDGMGAKTLISCIAPQNAASQRVAERLGARYERTIPLLGTPTDIYRHDPAARAAVMLGRPGRPSRAATAAPGQP